MQHGNLRALFGHDRHDCNGGCAGTDDRYVLTAIIQPFGPFLRMDDLPAKICAAGKIWRVTLVIIIIACAHEQEARSEMLFLSAIYGLGGNTPACLAARPVGRHDTVAEMDMAVDIIFFGGFVHIFMDRGAVGDSLFVQPRFEPVAQRVHVGIGSDTRITEQIPRSAHIGALLDDGVALVRTLHIKMRGGSYSRKPGAHYQYVNGDIRLCHSAILRSSSENLLTWLQIATYSATTILWRETFSGFCWR